MSKLNDTDELNVWVVRGPNWQATVQMNEYQTQFPLELQLHEAASQIVEMLKDVKVKGEKVMPSMVDNIQFKLDDGEERPFLGPVLYTYPLDSDPNKNVLIFTHVVLANCGFYKDSVEMGLLLEKEAQKIIQEEGENAKKLKSQLQEFKKLSGKSKTKKPNKKK